MCAGPIRWHQVEAYFTKPDYEIYDRGPNKIIVDMRGKRPRDSIVIDRDCCFIRSAEVLKPFLRQIENVFGVTPQQIVAGRRT